MMPRTCPSGRGQRRGRARSHPEVAGSVSPLKAKPNTDVRSSQCAPEADGQVTDIQEAARTSGPKVAILRAAVESDLDTAFSALLEQHADALVVGADPFFGLAFETALLGVQNGRLIIGPAASHRRRVVQLPWHDRAIAALQA